MSTSDPFERRLSKARRLAAALLGTSVGLLVAVAFLLGSRSSGTRGSRGFLYDPAVREQVVARLVSENSPVYDAFSDPDVGRINTAGLSQVEHAGVVVTTNRYGVREEPYELPKPEGTVRIVLLGDSLIWGYGVDAADRVGVFFAGWLRERAPGVAIECLHLAVPSWNVRNECAYLGRQLEQLQPDLVLHLIEPGDVEDSPGVRGFGSWASFSPAVRARADSSITAGFPIQNLGFHGIGLVRNGLDWESESRLEDARGRIEELAAAVEEAGGRYVLLPRWGGLLPVVQEHIGRHLPPEQVACIASAFSEDRRYWYKPDDYHWGRAGHERLALAIYGLVTQRDLLPSLALPEWDEAARVRAAIFDAGLEEAGRSVPKERIAALHGGGPIASQIDFSALDAPAARQIHGGVDRERRVSPYASILLRNPGARGLRVTGRGLEARRLAGTRVRVLVDAEEVGHLLLEPSGPIDARFPLPPASATRPFLSIRFAADDYVYAADDLQHCVVFRLDRLELL